MPFCMLKDFMGICMTMEEEGSLTKKKKSSPVYNMFRGAPGHGKTRD
jgi:hypothetical protein